MLTGKEELLDALIEAFLMEKGTKEFYAMASDKAVNSEAKKTFKELSEWEKKHMDYIQFLYQSVQGERELESFTSYSSRAKAPLTEAGIPLKELHERIEKRKFKDEQEALTLAMEIEGKAYNLYRKLSQKASDSNSKVVFKDMMEQEMRHIEYLKKKRNELIKVY
jgi:rubrerythrin